MALGERLLAGFFGLVGLVWVWRGLELPYWDRYAPGPGFLPVWIGAILAGLVMVLILRGEAAAPAEGGSWRKPALIAASLAICVLAVEWLGFVVGVGAYLAFLLLYVERLPPRLGGAVTVGATLAIYAVFDLWLRVPLPRGPWGF